MAVNSLPPRKISTSTLSSTPCQTSETTALEPLKHSFPGANYSLAPNTRYIGLLRFQLPICIFRLIPPRFDQIASPHLESGENQNLYQLLDNNMNRTTCSEKSCHFSFLLPNQSRTRKKVKGSTKKERGKLLLK